MERKDWIDHVRGIGILLMLLGHTNTPQSWHAWIYGFHMPLFYILSGFLHNKDKWEKMGFSAFVKTRFKSFIVPYFVWCTLCFFINLPLLYVEFKDDSLLLHLFQNIIWILTSIKIKGYILPQNCTPLWFLTSIFISSLALYLLLKVKKWMQICLCFLFIGLNALLTYYDVHVLPWHFEVSLVGSIFMLIGFYMKETNLLDKIRNPLIIVVLFILANRLIFLNILEKNVEMYYRRYNHVFLFILGSVCMTFCIMWIMKKIEIKNTPIGLFGTYSMIPLGINYTLNRYCNFGYNYFKNGVIAVDPDVKMNWLLLFVINLIVCFICIQLVKKNESKVKVLLGK